MQNFVIYRSIFSIKGSPYRSHFNNFFSQFKHRLGNHGFMQYSDQNSPVCVETCRNNFSPIFLQNTSKSNAIIIKRKKLFDENSKTWKFFPFIMCFSLPFLTKKEDEQPKDPVKHAMGLAIMALEEQNYKEAEMHLHEVLHIIQDQFDAREITEREFFGKRAHVYSSLANLGLLSKDNVKAESLFKEMIQDCLRCGMNEDNAVIIEVSLKLALIYAKRGDKQLAERGFLHCIDCQEKKISAMISSGDVDEEDLQNEQALLGMSRNYYSQFLHNDNRNKEALGQAKLALELAKSLYSEVHNNVINLHNDVAVFNMAIGEPDSVSEAEKILRHAIEICEKESSLFGQLPTLYCNLGSLLQKSGNQNEALKMTKRALSTLNSMGVPKDNPLHIKVNECLNNLKNKGYK